MNESCCSGGRAVGALALVFGVLLQVSVSVGQISTRPTGGVGDITPIPLTGACCRPDGTCAQTTKQACLVTGGTWHGVFTACTSTLCGPQVCGGIAGLVCDAGEFCKFAEGTCNIIDNQGVCTDIPDACTLQYDPVCGCDGVTYGNECAADMAGVSVDHQGECGPLGACCLPNNTCRRMSEAECEAECGFWRGPNTRCRLTPDPADSVKEIALEAMRGDDAVELGPIDVIPVNPCPIFDYRYGACCLGDGTCTFTHLCGCDRLGGTWKGPNTTCDDRGICIPHCCDPADEPGHNGNPFCFEGHTCCDGTWVCNGPTAEPACSNPGGRCEGCCDPDAIPPCFEGATCCSDGNWACNEGDLTPTCRVIGHECEECCDPATEPGTHGNPFCFEGHTCCADGVWRCNDFDLSNTCPNGDTGKRCPQCCDPSEQPGVGGNPICFEGASCCANGEWSCNEGDGSNTCENGELGEPCEVCCDPDLEPGVGGNPICFEGHSCCANGQWACNNGDGSPSCHPVGEVCGGVGKCCDLSGTCYDNVTQRRCEEEICGHWGGAGSQCNTTGGHLDCPIPPILIGACCLPDGTCVETHECDCRRQDGVWHGGHGLYVDCSQIDCPAGQQCGGPLTVVCPDGQYCHSPDGDCDGIGRCETPPTACPDVWDPVCGCDRQTYGNACEAAAAGQSILHDGPCGVSCETNEDCQIFGSPLPYYCAKAAGDCDGRGECAPVPFACPLIYAPVCGCDGRTYDNACFAASASVNVAHNGPCEQVCGGWTGIACPDGQYCDLGIGHCCCDFQGICRDMPRACPENYDPVCGCDGVTYSNACFAASAGVSIDHEGECCAQACGGPLDVVCPHGQYCQTDLGECDQIGCCADRPENCLDVWIPVCGCDGVTYSNGCYAARAGVSVAHDGPCELVGACCLISYGCIEVTEEECREACGFFQGVGTVCQDPWDPSVPANGIVCPVIDPIFGGCCLPDGECVDTYECDCNRRGGVWHAFEYCWESDLCHEPVVCGGILGVECPHGQYCNLGIGNCCCDFQGVCEDIPVICPAIYDPVCGCDGVTYGNSCEAAAAGQSIDHEGPCGAIGACCTVEGTCVETTEQDCRDNQCGLWRGEGSECPSSTGPGSIFLCPVIDPLYGACCLRDDTCITTYECDCTRRGGTWNPNVHCSATTCGQVCGGITGIPCDAGEYCDLGIGHCCCDFQGVCRDIPEVCPANYDPVCGCDGVTYGNACEAGAAGQSIDHPGPCAS